MAGGRQARPLSPHLMIYRLQITSVLSIAHRITGVALGAGLACFALWLAAAALGEGVFAPVNWLLTSWLGWLVWFGFSAAFYYHLLNGIRHLVWDWGLGLELRMVTLSGWLVVVGTVLLTLLTWIV